MAITGRVFPERIFTSRWIVPALFFLAFLMDSPVALKAAGAFESRTPLLGSPARPAGPESRKQILEHLGHLPLGFIENRGELNPRVKFYVHGWRETVFFTQEGVTFALAGKVPGAGPAAQEGVPNRERSPERPAATLRFIPLNMRPEAVLMAEERAPVRVHSYRGSDPAQWRTDIPVYQAVRYRDAYPGIDLRFYGVDGQLEYDVIVKPGADPRQVKFAWDGAEALTLATEGDLVAHLPGGGELVQHKPRISQERDGNPLVREGCFRICDGESRPAFTFELSEYDPALPLVIDPVLAYSTYLGGTFWDLPFGIAVDAKGFAYVTGWKNSEDFPVEGRTEASSDENVFLVKFSPSGDFYYTVFLGGYNDEHGNAVAVDSDGNAFVTGFTESLNFPLLYPPNAGIMKWAPYPPDFSNGFVARFDPYGFLEYSIYLGGRERDNPTSIAVAADGGVYVGGYTESPEFPYYPLFSEKGLHLYKGAGDGFVTYIPPNVSGQPFSTFLGGTGADVVTGLALDAAGNLCVVGNTESGDFPVKKAAFKTYSGNKDAFVAKITPALRSLVFSTYLGGTGGDEARGIALWNGNLFLAGWTDSENFPVKTPLYRYAGKGDAFVSRFSASGGLVFSTCLGGTNTEGARGIAVDRKGYAYVAGSTSSDDFPLKNPLKTAALGRNRAEIIIDKTYRAFVSKISPNGRSLVYSTKLGGTDGAETGEAIGVDIQGSAYVAGMTSSHDFPVKHPAQPYNFGYSPGFVTKLKGN